MRLLSRGLAVAVQNKKATQSNCGTGCNIVKFLKEKKWINAPKCLYLQTEIVRNQLT